MTDLDAPFEDPFDVPIDHPLMGQPVTVILDHDNPAGTIRGVLTAMDAGGGVSVRQPDGVVVHGWPCLEIRGGVAA